MKLLALDTATEACSVALSVDGEVTEHYEVAPQQHVRLLLPAIDRLMNDAGIKPVDLDGVTFGRGPGSFTGVRIAVSAAQAIAYAVGCPLVPVSTLEAMAHRAFREQAVTHCLPMIDARMGQVYWGGYTTLELGISEKQIVEQVSDPAAIVAGELCGSEIGIWSAAGTGYKAYKDILLSNQISGADNLSMLLPAAVDILHLSVARFKTGDTVTAEQAAPVYLRDKVASTEAEREGKRA